MKKYIKPSVGLVEVNEGLAILDSGPGAVVGDDVITGGRADSKRRWGNLWVDDEEEEEE